MLSTFVDDRRIANVVSKNYWDVKKKVKNESDLYTGGFIQISFVQFFFFENPRSSANI